MTTKSPNFLKKFNCEFCSITTDNKKDYNNHLLTRKHINKEKRHHLATTHINISHKEKYWCINCNKNYESRSGLWRHEKKCNTVETKETNQSNETINQLKNQQIQLKNEQTDLKNILIELVKSNTELQKQMLEVCKNSNTTINNNNNNSKTFNMQVFLNEKCKDAMNIMDFVDSMNLQLSDLEELGELGYVEGISRQMIRKLSELDVYKRPIHCSDQREKPFTSVITVSGKRRRLPTIN